MEFFFDPIDNPDREAESVAYQAFYRNVTWACADCGSERTLELTPESVERVRQTLPARLRAAVTAEKVPSGLHYRVSCVDCGKTTNGMPPKRYRASGGADVLELRLVRPGHCVIGWGIVDEITPSSKDRDKCTVTLESGATFDHDADDVVMIMSQTFDHWKAHAIPGSAYIDDDQQTDEPPTLGQ